MFVAGIALPIKDLYIYYKVEDKENPEETKLVD